MSDSSGFDFINRTLSGEDRSGEIDEGRRKFLEAAAATGTAAATAGCITGSKTTGPSTTTETETPTTTDPTTTEEEPTTTQQQEPVTVKDLRRKRAQLSEAEKQVQYQQAVPNNSNYDLDMNRVLEENNSLEEQIFDIYTTVGNQTHTRTGGNHKIVHALNQHPEIGWEQKNLTNIVTWYASQPGEMVTINYEGENTPRQADGMWDRQTADKTNYMPNIPDSEAMDGDEGNFLITDTEVIKEAKEAGRLDAESWENIQLAMQTIVPGIIGRSVNANGHSGRDAKDNQFRFNGDAINYIGESYKDSADAMLDVTIDGIEIDAATEDARLEGNYIEIGADEEGLYTTEVYDEDKGEEMMKQPVDF